MANANAPTGLSPVRYLSGAPYNGACNRYYVPSGDGTAIYVGGLVKPGGTADANGVMSVTGNVATGNPVVGVVVAVEPVTRDSTIHRAASTERYVWVADDPNLLFKVQEDSVGGALAVTAVGNSADLTGFTSGSATTGLSSIQIDSNTATASGDGTEDVVVFGLANTPDNAIGDYAKWLVRLNNHFYVDGSAGA
ncbi:hypothetical protein L2U69_11850 [Zavarzinia compransoris]|uniref:hypothetical protein n=1 Tax=Zavarzinia marina TaxID=2911065 RepID=UPI001F40BAA9|nr:hypothetical protein [Zavarzinia marina]MCF4166340.1 hypothetical protein [Zavarzinia marina]